MYHRMLGHEGWQPATRKLSLKQLPSKRLRVMQTDGKPEGRLAKCTGIRGQLTLDDLVDRIQKVLVPEQNKQ